MIEIGGNYKLLLTRLFAMDGGCDPRAPYRRHGPLSCNPSMNGYPVHQDGMQSWSLGAAPRLWPTRTRLVGLGEDGLPHPTCAPHDRYDDMQPSYSNSLV